MHSGMLWYDNGPKDSLEDRLRRAIEYYRHKYGRAPTLCLVSQGALDEAHARIDGITVRAYGPMLPAHFWIGVEDEPTTRRLRANGNRKGHRLIRSV